MQSRESDKPMKEVRPQAASTPSTLLVTRACINQYDLRNVCSQPMLDICQMSTKGAGLLSDNRVDKRLAYLRRLAGVGKRRHRWGVESGHVVQDV